MDGASVSVHDYTVFGLRVRSSLPLPELFAAVGEGPVEVTILTGTVVGPDGAEEGLHVDDDGLVLIIPDVAKFRISGGDTIVVEANADVPERNVRLFLLGSAFGALLHQRGLLPLHANAVEVGGKAYAFMGRSGAGKSTLAAWFHDRGHLVLADDVCVVRFDEAGRAWACPGLPRLRLWLDALELTGRELEGLKRSYIGQSAQLDKYDVPVEASAMIHADVPVGGIYLLNEGDSFEVTALTGMEAAEAIFSNTYRGAYVAAASSYRGHWQSAVALARSTPVHRVQRTMDFANFDRECEMLLEHLAGD
jgi:hypothetical protein